MKCANVCQLPLQAGDHQQLLVTPVLSALLGALSAAFYRANGLASRLPDPRVAATVRVQVWGYLGAVAALTALFLVRPAEVNISNPAHQRRDRRRLVRSDRVRGPRIRSRGPVVRGRTPVTVTMGQRLTGADYRSAPCLSSMGHWPLGIRLVGEAQRLGRAAGPAAARFVTVERAGRQSTTGSIPSARSRAR